MWEFEYSLDTAATPDTLWRYWSDLTTWPQWNDGIEKIAINGPFAAGTTFTMTPPEGDPITLRPLLAAWWPSIGSVMAARNVTSRPPSTTSSIEPAARCPRLSQTRPGGFGRP